MILQNVKGLPAKEMDMIDMIQFNIHCMVLDPTTQLMDCESNMKRKTVFCIHDKNEIKLNIKNLRKKC